MKYTVTYQRTTHKHPSAPPLETKLVLRAAPGEVPWHIGLKIVGYALFMEYEPRIEEGIGWHYKPDLVALDDSGNLTLWVDCGNIAVRKIVRVAQKVGSAPFYILRKTPKDATLLAQSLQGKVKHAERVNILAFDRGFVDTFSSALEQTNTLRISVSPTSIDAFLENRKGEQHFTSQIHAVPIPYKKP